MKFAAGVVFGMTIPVLMAVSWSAGLYHGVKFADRFPSLQKTPKKTPAAPAATVEQMWEELVKNARAGRYQPTSDTK